VALLYWFTRLQLSSQTGWNYRLVHAARLLSRREGFDNYMTFTMAAALAGVCFAMGTLVLDVAIRLHRRRYQPPAATPR